MIVSKSNFDEVVPLLAKESELGLDTETTGLRMYHGDKLFSIILATDKVGYYFNFKDYPDEADFKKEFLLEPKHLAVLNWKLFQDDSKTWFIQNAANFDLPILSREKIELAGTVHCTKAIGRVVRNDEISYSLEAQLQRIGLAKSDLVMEYIMEHKLYTVTKVPGKAKQDKLLHFDRVPFKVIAPYGEIDGTGVASLGKHQLATIKKMDLELPELSPGRSVFEIMDNERRLQKTIHRMKEVGVQIDVEYCKKAIRFESYREEMAKKEFVKLTGDEYKASPKLFTRVFAGEKDKWQNTEKGNPSFESKVLTKFNHQAARAVLEIRDAKSKSDFYNGFLYHADAKGILHPNYNPEGTIHGRFSSSNPNFQNLTSEEDEDQIAQEFVVRRAIIPRPGFVMIMPDYDQMEYKFALEQACRVVETLTPLGIKIVKGHDFHDATKEIVLEVTGLKYSRKVMKVTNFLTLYGGGDKTLAADLNISVAEAKAIRLAIKKAAPEIEKYIHTVMRVAEERKFVINWMGRRSYFPFRSLSYRAPNYLISGGCADVVKVAMNRIDNYLLTKKSNMIMTVHDELPIEVHESEIEEVPKIVHELMEGVYQSKYIPLTAGMEYSHKSLGDKNKGFP